MRKALFGALFSVFILGGLLNCSSGPEIQPREEKKNPAPEWVGNPPKDTPEKVYFVGSAENSQGSLPGAEADAVNSLIAEVTRYIGVRVSSETTVEARDTLEDYQQSITESITQTSSARVSDFRVEDKWIDRENNRVAVHILGSYDRGALEEEKARIEAVFREQQEAVFGPEGEADDLMAEREYFPAALKYMEAAKAAAESELENADIRFRRNMGKAKDAFARIHLHKMSGEKRTFVGEPFDGPFELKVTAGSSRTAPGVRDIPIRVVHRVLTGGGKTGLRSVSISTDSGGILSYSMPVPDIAGNDKITALLDVEAWLEPFYSLPKKYQDEVSGLEAIITDKRVVFDYTVVSRAASIPMGILILDVDQEGMPMDVSNTAAGISDRLSEAGFQFTVLRMPPGDISNKTDDQIVKMVDASDASLERVLFGTCRIEELNELDGSILVKAAGTIKVVDLESGSILLSETQFKHSRGSSPLSTVSAAFRGLGRSFGDVLTRRLP